MKSIEILSKPTDGQKNIADTWTTSQRPTSRTQHPGTSSTITLVCNDDDRQAGPMRARKDFKPTTKTSHKIQPKVIQEPVTVQDEDHAVANPSSDHRRQLSNKVAPEDKKRSRSRERAPPHVPPHADEESATVEPQSRVSDHSRSPQRKESLQEQSPQKQKRKKTMAEVKKLSDLPKAKKHKPMDSDENDEEPQNETGTSTNTQPIVPVLPLQQGPAL